MFQAGTFMERGVGEERSRESVLPTGDTESFPHTVHCHLHLPRLLCLFQSLEPCKLFIGVVVVVVVVEKNCIL